MSINRKSPIPIYLQIKEDILMAILDGEIQDGDRILSETKLATKYAVNRQTARNAVTELVNEGYLSRIHGQGTFVSKKRVEDQRGGITSFMQDMRRRGFTVRSELLVGDIIDPDFEIAEQMQLEPLESVYRIKRRRLVNEDIVVLQDAYIPVFQCPNLLAFDLENDSLYRILTEEYKIGLAGAKESLEAVGADPETAKYLEVAPGTPVLFSTRRTVTDENSFVEFCRSWYRSDRYIFNINLGDASL